MRFSRRRLILTTLGALAGCLGLPKVALAAVERNSIPALPAKFESTGAVVSGPITGLADSKVPIAELYVSVCQDVNEAISKAPVLSKQEPLVQIGSLLISNEAEADAFIARMADAIRASAERAERGAWRG